MLSGNSWRGSIPISSQNLAPTPTAGPFFTVKNVTGRTREPHPHAPLSSTNYAATKIKLAVSSLVSGERTLDFGGGQEELRELVNDELRLYAMKAGSAALLQGTRETPVVNVTTGTAEKEILEGHAYS